MCPQRVKPPSTKSSEEVILLDAAEGLKHTADDEHRDAKAKAAFEAEAAKTEKKVAEQKAEDASLDTGEMSILDAVNTDNLPEDVTAKDISAAEALVEEEDGSAATVEAFRQKSFHRSITAKSHHEEGGVGRK